jgi:hypothetical protein
MTGTRQDEFVEWPEAVAAKLARAYPSYTVTLRRDRGKPRYQLVSKTDAYPSCLISSDPDEIREELNGSR